MRRFASDPWWYLTLVALTAANAVLLLILTFGNIPTFFSSWLWYVIWYSLLFTYYFSMPLALFGFVSALAWAAVKRPERASTLALLSGGALFCAFLVWNLFPY